MRRVVGVGMLAALAAPLSAQQMQAARGFDHGVVIDSDWLQANALPLNRAALHSVSAGVSLRRDRWAINGDWVRIARDLSTVQGGAVSVGPLVSWRRLVILPAVGAFLGQAQASRDTTGYDYAAVGTTPGGHVARYSYSSGISFGGSVGLTLEVPVYRGLGVRATVQQFYLSGDPLDNDRSRTVVGAGLSWRVFR